MRRLTSIPLAALAACLIVGCTESPQTVATKGNTPAWMGAKDAFVVPGWKVGDRNSWEQHMQARALTQNEYRRMGTSQ